MRIGRELLTGMGWAGTLGVVALCTLMFLFTYVAFDGAQKRRRRDEAALGSRGSCRARARHSWTGRCNAPWDRATPSRTRRSVSDPRSTHPLGFERGW